MSFWNVNSSVHWHLRPLVLRYPMAALGLSLRKRPKPSWPTGASACLAFSSTNRGMASKCTFNQTLMNYISSRCKSKKSTKQYDARGFANWQCSCNYMMCLGHGKTNIHTVINPVKSITIGSHPPALHSEEPPTSFTTMWRTTHLLLSSSSHRESQMSATASPVT